MLNFNELTITRAKATPGTWGLFGTGALFKVPLAKLENKKYIEQCSKISEKEWQALQDLVQGMRDVAPDLVGLLKFLSMKINDPSISRKNRREARRTQQKLLKKLTKITTAFAILDGGELPTKNRVKHLLTKDHK